MFAGVEPQLGAEGPDSVVVALLPGVGLPLLGPEGHVPLGVADGLLLGEEGGDEGGGLQGGQSVVGGVVGGHHNDVLL